MTKNNISDFSQNLLSRFQSIDGMIVGRDMQSSEINLAEDEKGAIVNDVVDKYIRKELTDEYLQQAKEKFKITTTDITREIVKREIKKVLGI